MSSISKANRACSDNFTPRAAADDYDEDSISKNNESSRLSTPVKIELPLINKKLTQRLNQG